MSSLNENFKVKKGLTVTETISAGGSLSAVDGLFLGSTDTQGNILSSGTDLFDLFSGGGVQSLSAGDGLLDNGTATDPNIAVDSTVVRTTGDQTIAGVKTFTDTVKVDSLISHTGDDDTRIALNTNQVNIEAGGNCGLQVNSGSVIVNQDSGSVNFRVEGDTDAALLMANAATDKVGIGTTDPSDKLEVYGSGADVALRIHEDAGTHEARLHLRKGGNDWEIINNGNLAFEIEGSEIVRFKTDGSVGIGTDNPGEALDVIGNVQVTDGEFIGDLRGAVHFKAQAGEDISEGEAVYISGISGNTTVVSLADADDASKMPAFGIATETATSGNPITVGNFGALAGLNTTQWGAEGDELFVGTTAGQLVSAAPTGESAALQKIAKITRAHASSGSITIMGAGRSNAVPNLDSGDIFIGNGSNQAVTAPLAACICGTGDARYIQGVTTGSYLTGGGLTGCVEVGLDSACASKWDASAAGGVTSLSAGDGLLDNGTASEPNIAVDSTVVRTTGTQTVGGLKTFSDAVCITGGSTTTDAFCISNTDNDSDAAPIQTFKRNSDTPSSGDYLGQLKFKGVNDNSQEVVYSKITSKINDEQGGTERGLFEIAVQKSGTMTIVARHTDTDLKLINGTGLEVDGNILSAGSNLNSLFSNCQGTITGFDSGGDGITIDSSDPSSVVVEVDSSIVRTTGAQSIAGVKTFTDHVYVNECIVHAGDTDTGIRFNTDGIKLETGGEAHLCLSNTGVEVNVANNSNDFRVKTDDVNNSLFVSGSSNNVGAGTDIPNYKLTVANGDFGVANSNKIYVGGATTDSVIGYLGNTSGDLTLQGDGNRDVIIGSGSNPDAIFVKGTDGSVGIGTDSPAEKLTVNGSLSTNGAILSGGVNIAEMFGGGGGDGVCAGTACKLTKYNAAGNNVEDSIVTESSSLITVAGSLDADAFCSNDSSNNIKYGLQVGAGGIANTGIGCCAANSMSVGFNNVAIGPVAMAGADGICCNVAIGVSAGRKLSNGGDDNVAIGTNAMRNGTSIADSVAIGNCAMGSGATTGCCNIAIGFESMMNAVAACNNTAVGSQSMRAITGGEFNTAMGFKALCSVTGGDRNTALGAVAGQSIAGGCDNTAVGFRALCGAVTGCNNIAMGRQAMKSVVTGSDNIGIGQDAISLNTAGCCNVAIGQEAMCGNTEGSYNVSIGQQSMRYALSGDHNMALGQYALYDNWGGDYNTAVGTAAMQCNTTGSNNAALGYRAMFNNTTGNDNFAVGECALQSNVNGIGNTAVGHNAFGCNVTGNYTVAIGDNAGALYANGCTALSASSDSIYIGRNTRGKNNDDCNSIVIGHDACSCGQNTIKLGNGSITAACIQVAWTTVSDERDKTCIEDLNKGLEFIGDLKPKSFEYREDRSTTKGTGVKRYGFLAQDVLAAEGEDNVIVSENNEDQLGLNSDYLVPILVKAVQELEARVAELEGN